MFCSPTLVCASAASMRARDLAERPERNDALDADPPRERHARRDGRVGVRAVERRTLERRSERRARRRVEQAVRRGARLPELRAHPLELRRTLREPSGSCAPRTSGTPSSEYVCRTDRNGATRRQRSVREHRLGRGAARSSGKRTSRAPPPRNAVRSTLGAHFQRDYGSVPTRTPGKRAISAEPIKPAAFGEQAWPRVSKLGF